MWALAAGKGAEIISTEEKEGSKKKDIGQPKYLVFRGVSGSSRVHTPRLKNLV
jgi:hypothetical protein